MNERKENNQGFVESIYKFTKSAISEIPTYAHRLREFSNTHDGKTTITLGTTSLLLSLGFISIAARGDLKLIMAATAGVALPTVLVVGIGLLVEHRNNRVPQ